MVWSGKRLETIARLTMQTAKPMQAGQQHGISPPRENEHHWKEDVELLLDANAPHQCHRGRHGKDDPVPQEKDVGEGQLPKRQADRFTSKQLQVSLPQQRKQSKIDKQCGVVDRPYTKGPAGVKVEQADRTERHFFAQQ
jgi:hypothetical protein